MSARQFVRLFFRCSCSVSIGILSGAVAFAQDTQPYRYNMQTRASDFAREFFGPQGQFERSQRLNMGNASVGVSTELDCGNLDVRANVFSEFMKIQKQVRSLVPNEKNIGRFLSASAMVATCYAYPTVCAQLRHDFLSFQANLDLRSQACRAIDGFIDNQAEKGAKQLKAEAQAQCVDAKLRQTDPDTKSKYDPASAIAACQDQTGLAIRDFQSGLEKKFTSRKQKVLQSIVSFAQTGDERTYDFLASMLGEIEVQSDGYWQPLFAKGMLRPHDMAASFLAEGQEKACGDLSSLFANRGNSYSGLPEKTITEVIRKKMTRDDLSNLEDLGVEDRRLACAALGRAIGQVAAEKAAAEGEAVVASGLLNTAIPNSLRDEYRSRSSAAFQALKKTLESDQIPPVEEVRAAIAQLARVTRERNRLIASQLSRSKLENSRQESAEQSDCVDTLSCGR